MNKKHSNLLRERLSPLWFALLAALIGFALGQEWQSPFLNQPIPVSSADAIRFFYSPHGKCTTKIVEAIDNAEKTIYVYAYSLTSEAIANALVRAHQRGVHLEIIASVKQYRAERKKNYSIKSTVAKMLQSKQSTMHLH